MDKDFFKYNFGLLVVVRSELSEYNILTRAFGQVQCLRILPDNILLGTVDNSHLEAESDDIAYEVYPYLPFIVSSISQFLNFIAEEYYGDILKLVFYTTISQGLKAVFPLLTVYVTTTVVSLGSLPLTFEIGFIALFLSLFATVSLYLQSRVIQKLESESDRRAQTAVWDRLMKIDLGYISPYKPADLVSRAASISQVRTLLSSQNITSLIALVFSVVYLIEMYMYLPVPTLFTLPLLFGFIAVVTAKSRSGGALLTGSLETNAEITDFSNSIFRGLPELSTSRSLSHLSSYWKVLISKSAAFSFRYRQKDNSLDTFSGTFLSLSFLISFASIIGFDGQMLSDPNFLSCAIGYTSALTIFCSTLSAGTVSIVNSLINVLSYWQRARPIAFSPVEAGYNSTCYSVDINGDISIENIFFSYSVDLPDVFSGFSLSVQSNKLNILDIPRGCGTTTLFHLLLGLYPVSSGSIYFGSHKLDHILISSLRSQIKLAPQDLNIPIGNLYRLFRGPLSLTDESLSEFVNAFGLGKFIQGLRMGIDTPLSNNGKLFPDKIRQLFSLAYSASQVPKILLVDNCLDQLSLDEKYNIFSFLLTKGVTILLSDPDAKALLLRLYPEESAGNQKEAA